MISRIKAILGNFYKIPFHQPPRARLWLTVAAGTNKHHHEDQ
ncbi:MAG: hypothetical protein BWY09_00069 [Candidatus Hydrogenedentes bacterium ADurb.Bin179]|nr:MAG: hypothetical protein BWY09_00069 [Candidatus Hydrogenedentes bacterium ADurb.Bin179]